MLVLVLELVDAAAVVGAKVLMVVVDEQTSSKCGQGNASPTVVHLLPSICPQSVLSPPANVR